MPAHGFAPVRTVATSRKRLSEDAWGAVHDDGGRPRAVWVADGATPLGATDPAVGNAQVAHFAWALSRSLGAELGRALRAGPPAELTAGWMTAIIEEARGRAQGSFETRFGRASCPTATLSLVLRARQHLLAWTIGDSPLWIETDQGLVAVADPQYEGGEERVLRQWQELRAGGLAAEIAYRRVLDGQAAARGRRNTPDGLWILGASDRAAVHGRFQRFRLPAPVRVAVLSDGLERGVAPFRLATREQLFGALHAGSGLPLARRLRAAEDADPRRTRVPRLTAHDDITGVAAAL